MIRLRGMAFDHPRSLMPLEASAKEYLLKHPGLEISWDAHSLKDFEEYPVEKLADTYDLFVMDHPFVGTGVETGVLLPLDEYAPEAYLADQRVNSVGPSYESYSWEGHQWALAIDAAAQVSAYRSDLLDEAKLGLPRTWDEVFELADSLPPGREIGVPLNPTHSYCTFLTLCANIGGNSVWDEASGLATSIAQEALRSLKKLARVAHEASLELNPIQLLSTMSQSSEIAYAPFVFGYSNYARPGFAPHIVRFADIPSTQLEPTGSVLGGVGLAVSARSENKQAAVDYAFFVASEECQRGLYFENGGQPGHRVAWTDPSVNERSSGFFESTLRTLDFAYLRPRYVGYPVFQGHAGKIVHRFLTDGANGRETIESLNHLYEKTKMTIGELG